MKLLFVRVDKDVQTIYNNIVKRYIRQFKESGNLGVS
jgi:hypothetical protein